MSMIPIWLEITLTSAALAAGLVAGAALGRSLLPRRRLALRVVRIPRSR